MKSKTVAALTGRLLLLIATLMLAPLGVALVDRMWRSATAYGVGFQVTALAALGLVWWGRNAPSELHRKDALGAVALTWAALGVFGALPFLIEGSISDPLSAVFESVSGFTTTGATVIADVDGLSRATNLWRCLNHWIGGMGIVVLFVAVFPQLGVGAKHLFKAEVPGPITEGLRPRIKQSALMLWWIYLALTCIAAGALHLAGVSWYEAICHAFSTLGTGGFSTRTLSIGAYQSATIDWIVIVFMFIASLNFGLFYAAVQGRLSELTRNYEARFFLLVNLLVIALVAWSIRDRHPDGLTAVRFAAFQTVAVTSTTGFMTEDFDAYPDVARFALFLCMFMGGCAGSTAGGLKASRIYALFKLCLRELKGVVQPSAVIAIRLGQTVISPAISSGILVPPAMPGATTANSGWIRSKWSATWSNGSRPYCYRRATPSCSIRTRSKNHACSPPTATRYNKSSGSSAPGCLAATVPCW